MTSAFGFSGIILNGKSIQVKMGGGGISNTPVNMFHGVSIQLSHMTSQCAEQVIGSSLSPNVFTKRLKYWYSSGTERAFLVFAAYLCE